MAITTGFRHFQTHANGHLASFTEEYIMSVEDKKRSFVLSNKWDVWKGKLAFAGPQNKAKGIGTERWWSVVALCTGTSQFTKANIDYK